MGRLSDHRFLMTHAQNLPWSLGPYDWLPATDPKTIEASDIDATVRPVGVTVFLEDPRARTAYVYVRPPAETEYHVNTDAGTVVDLWLRATPDGQFLNSVLLGTHAASAKQAFDRSYAYLLSLLSLWSFQAQRPMAVREILVDDRPHGAQVGRAATGTGAATAKQHQGVIWGGPPPRLADGSVSRRDGQYTRVTALHVLLQNP